MGSMEEAEREEEEGKEEEEESLKELEPEEEDIAMATGAGGLVFSALLGFGRKKEFAVKKSRFGVRLNSKRMEDGSAVSHSTRSQLQRRCIFLGGCSVFNEH
jgi:hypothetical protein